MSDQDLAKQIAQARQTGNQATVELPDPRPSLAEALALQDKVFAEFGSPSVGWKVGATNEGAQKAFGLDGPFYGPIARSGVTEDGASIAKTDCVMAVEPEYAFRMSRNYPEDREEISSETIGNAVAACHIALEVIGRCVGSESFQNGIGLTIDFAGNSAFVVGPEIENWRDADLVNAAVDGLADDAVINSGSGAMVMGNPVDSLVWMAKALANRGLHLKAGEWVSTGTCTAPVPAKAGETVTGRFGDFGSVSVRFT